MVPSGFNSYTQFFFSTADNWIKITPIHKPQREKMWHYHCKEKGFFKHRNVIETLIFIGSTTPPQHHFKKYFWRKKLLCAEINFILWLYNTLFVLINRFIVIYSSALQEPPQIQTMQKMFRISMHKKYIEGNKINLKYFLKALYHKKEI